MALSPTDLVLHHHDASYYSHKARMLLGAKGATWHSVIAPLISPKPDLARLTGGYVRVPVLQVGADLFCDTKVVLGELDRRTPGPSLAGPLDEIVNAWVDKVWTPATFAVALPDMAPSMTDTFVADRAAMFGPAFDLDAIAGASPLMHEQWRAQAVWLEEALRRSGGPFLTGAQPTVADVVAALPLWLFDTRMQMAQALARPEAPADTVLTVPADRPDDHAERLLAGLPEVRAWRDRIVALGQGDRQEATAEDALALAASCDPAPAPPHDDDDPSGLVPGAAVTVVADDSGRDPVTGTLVALTCERVVLAREAEDLGRVHVHLPRFSYFVSAA